MKQKFDYILTEEQEKEYNKLYSKKPNNESIKEFFNFLTDLNPNEQLTLKTFEKYQMLTLHMLGKSYIPQVNPNTFQIIGFCDLYDLCVEKENIESYLHPITRTFDIQENLKFILFHYKGNGYGITLPDLINYFLKKTESYFKD